MIKLVDKFAKPFISDSEYSEMKAKAKKAFEDLVAERGVNADMTGWRLWPENYDREEYTRLCKTAEKIKKKCDVFIIIGVGGSYLGAKAVIDFVNAYRHTKKTPEIVFAGNSFSAGALYEVISKCEGKDVCVNIISKSGSTTEPSVAFRIIRGMMESKYGVDGARERIFVTTDKVHGVVRQFADSQGYQIFTIPDNIGGRFSVFTSVGLLPAAVAGVDTDGFINGARAALADLSEADPDKNDALKYATLRNLLYNNGKINEILVSYEPCAKYLCEWWKQLFGESEGKGGKGIYPSSLIYSTDLHSLGQYVQDGMKNIFETVIHIKNSDYSGLVVPRDDKSNDGLDYLEGMSLSEINAIATRATVLAHYNGGVPNIVVKVTGSSAYSLGYLMYFFELACAVSGSMLGVDPYNQPGVEIYKNNIYALLGRPGYDSEREKLQKAFE